MSSNTPPNPNVNTFNNLYWITGDSSLTQSQADLRYLKYPVAQGTETLKAIEVDGNANFNTTTTFDGNATFTGTADIIQESGSQILQQPASTGYSTTDNVLNGSEIRTTYGQSTNTSLRISDASSLKGIYFLPNASNNAYNNLVNAGDCVIASTNSSPLVLVNSTTNGNQSGGIRLDNTQNSIGFGGTADTPSTNIVCNASTISVSPSITFPDGKVQNSAFTGAGALTGSYTLSNITIDSNGKITAISSGSAGTQFVPKFHNFADYQTGTSGYSQGAYINWSSGWGALDYVIIRVRSQVNWNISSGEYNSYATTAGELIIRPHYAPAGVIGSPIGSPSIFYSTNSGSICGATKKLIYYTGAINNGTQSYFFVYGNGGSGGGSSGYIQLMCDAPGTANGWQYTCSYEYIIHSTSGASITFSNGVGTNNSLP